MPKVNVEPGPYPKINSSVRKNFKGVATLKEQGEVYKEGLTQDELAQKAKCSRQFINMLENNDDINVSVQTLANLAQALDKTIDELVFFEK
jgi:DNA-binding XRE family transcriptional regulator